MVKDEAHPGLAKRLYQVSSMKALARYLGELAFAFVAGYREARYDEALRMMSRLQRAHVEVEDVSGCDEAQGGAN